MAIRREWGNVGTVAQLGALAGQAQARREEGQMRHQAAMQDQQIHASLAQTQMQIDQQNKALGMQMQRDQMQNEMQLASQRMQMEWQAQQGVIQQQNRFAFEEHKWQVREQHELDKQMRMEAEIDNQIKAVQKTVQSGDISQAQADIILEGLYHQKHLGSVEPSLLEARQHQMMQAGQQRERGPAHSASYFQPTATAPAPVERSMTPFIMELDQLPKEAPDSTWRQLGRLESIRKRQLAAPTFWKSRFVGYSKSYAPTEDTAVQTYDRWRKTQQYADIPEVQKRVMDAQWDEMMRRKGHGDIWDPESDRVKAMRSETFRSPTEAEARQIYDYVMQDPDIQQAITAGEVTPQEAARQLAITWGYKL